jgi:hypothetical protein
MFMNLLQIRILLRALTSKEGYQLGFKCLETEPKERFFSYECWSLVNGHFITDKEPVWAVYLTYRYLVSQEKGALGRILGRKFEGVPLLA